MDEIRSRIMNLLSKQPAKIPSMGFTDANYHFPTTTTATTPASTTASLLCINSRTAPEVDRPSDQEILESIAAAYFASSDTSFDISRFELEKLPAQLDCERIQADFTQLKRQHQVVSKKVLQLILEQQSACASQFDEALHLVAGVGDTLRACQDGRVRLRAAERQVGETLRVLAGHRRRMRAHRLLAALRTIRALHRTGHALRALLARDQYAPAIALILECQRAARAHAHFTCVAQLQQRLQETLDYADEQLDAVLAAMCTHFDAERYGRLQAAYALLEKTHVVVDHLHMHYVSAIYSTAARVVGAHASSTDGASAKRPYKNICESVEQEKFIPCLLALCRALFKILLSYRHLLRWHETNDGGDEVRAQLTRNVAKIWADVQAKVCGLLAATSGAVLVRHTFEQFVHVVHVLQRLIAVGDEFGGGGGGGCASHELRAAIRTQSAIYFRAYHAQRIDELRIFVEHEAWRVCPVRATFDLLQLHEFRTFRRHLSSSRRAPPLTSPPPSTSSSAVDDSTTSSTHSQDGNYFVRCAERGTPFDDDDDDLVDVVVDEHILVSDDDDDDELHVDFVDESTRNSERRVAPPGDVIINNTTLSVLRQMGKYMQMSRLLPSIAVDIVRGMTQLFEYCVYAVHALFTADLTLSAGSLYTQTLSATLRRIRETLPADDGAAGGGGVVMLSPAVDLTQPESLFGLAERIVAVESLVFLGAQYETLQPHIESLASPVHNLFLQQFFTQTITSGKDLRRPVYMSVCARAFDVRAMVAAMAKIDWEVMEVMSQQNGYVDHVLRDVQIFAMRMQCVSGVVHIGDDVARTLWEHIAHIVTHTLVAGFAEAKRCTPCGRALMRLDFAHFAHRFEMITQMRPLPHRAYVDAYINAFYIAEAELDAWMRTHHATYTAKHLHALVACVCHNNKKSKQRLLHVIDELHRTSSS